MRASSVDDRWVRLWIIVVGAVLPVVVWVAVKYGFQISNRYLPGPLTVVTAFKDIEPSIFVQAGATVLRLLEGGLAGVVFGIGAALILHTRPLVGSLFMPSIQAFRSIPAVATVPFFLLWFGFEEVGKFLLIFMAIGLNVLVAAFQILDEAPEKYRVAMRSFTGSSRSFPLIVALPLVVERILPTLRTTLSIAFGVVVVAELLGSQVGLGYLIATSRATYAIHVIFLCTFILGLLNTALDRALVLIWGRLVYWNRGVSRD